MEKRVKVALAFVVVAWIVALIVLVQIYGGSAPGAPPAAVTVSAVPVPQQPEPGSSPGVFAAGRAILRRMLGWLAGTASPVWRWASRRQYCIPFRNSPIDD